jgi:hypothetical protein
MKPIDCLANHIKNFVAQPRIEDVIGSLFDYADSRGRCGFEKWIQFELVLYFLGQDINPCIEEKINADGRKRHQKSFLQFDIIAELRSEEKFGIELKVRRAVGKAVSAIQSDLLKISKAIGRDKPAHCFAIVFFGESKENIGKETLGFFKEHYVQAEVINVVPGRAAALIVQEK